MRAFYRLTDQDDSNPYTFEVDSERMDVPYRTALATPIGADGAFDLHGDARSPLDAGRARIDLTLTSATTTGLDTEIANLLQAARGSTRSKGLRKLWRKEVSGDTDERFTWARLRERPDLRLSADHVVYKPASLDFLLPDPRFYEALTESYIQGKGWTAEQIAESVLGEPIMPNNWFIRHDVTSTPYSFTVTNEGDWETRRLIFRLHSIGAGFTDPRIENLTTGQEWSHTYDGGGSADILQINCSPGLGRAQWSVTGGSTWTDKTAELSIGSTQAVVMELAPGDNTIRYTDGGTPNLKLYVWWLHAYED